MLYQKTINVISTTTFIVVILLILSLVGCSQKKEPPIDAIPEVIFFVDTYNH